MKKGIVVRIIFDTANDEFKISQDCKGFDEKTPQQNALLIASMLEVARREWLKGFEK